MGKRNKSRTSVGKSGRETEREKDPVNETQMAAKNH